MCFMLGASCSNLRGAHRSFPKMSENIRSVVIEMSRWREVARNGTKWHASRRFCETKPTGDRIFRSLCELAKAHGSAVGFGRREARRAEMRKTNPNRTIRCNAVQPHATPFNRMQREQVIWKNEPTGTFRNIDRTP